MVITHRGHNTDFTENTIPAFDKAIALGAQGVECDLRLTLDNQVVAHHDKNFALSGKRIEIAKVSSKDLLKAALVKGYGLLTLDPLFDYINKKNVPFFLEVKGSSTQLCEKVIQKIREKHLWQRVYIIGFSFFIGTAVRLQTKYPKLRVMQLINIPLFSYIRKPAKSYGVFLGWSDELYRSEWLFRKLIPVRRLIKLKEFYEKNGFKVMAGVINSKSAFKYLEQAGITNIITDNVSDAIKYFKQYENK